MRSCQIVSAVLLGMVTISGCGGDGKTDVSTDRLKAMAGGDVKAVVPVKGVVNIDGSPAVGVNIFIYREDNPKAVVKEARTDDNGKYCLTSYQPCDGIEPGSYIVGFTHIPKPKKKAKAAPEQL